MTVRLACCGCLAMLLASIPASAQTLWTQRCEEMILPESPPAPGRDVALTGVRNEAVSFQMGLRADRDVAGPLTFEWTALAGPGGKTIDRQHVRLFRAADIEVAKGARSDAGKDPLRVRPAGKFPDALVPLLAADNTNIANAVALAKDVTLSFWVDVHIPADAPAGAYRGSITCRDGSRTVGSVTLALTVADLTIPADSSIPSLYNLRVHPHVVANADAYVAEMFRHRVQPTNYHYVDYVNDRRFGWTLLDKFNPDARGFVNVYYPVTSALSDEKRKATLATLRQITDHLKQRGLFERSFLHLKDEPDAGEIPGMAQFARAVLAELPEWKGKLADTCNKEGTELDGLLTHHIRALKCYGTWYGQQGQWGGRAEWDRRRAAGEQLWFYVSNAQGTPFPTFDVNAPALAFEPRVLGWAWWYEKAYGHLYWDLMFQPQWKLHPKFPPGDGQLIYPGDLSLPGAPDWTLVKDLKGPVVSRRLKLFRDGLEEWELLRLAEKKAGRPAVQALVDDVYTCMGQRTWAPDAYDPAKPMWAYDLPRWDRARQALLDLLSKP